MLCACCKQEVRGSALVFENEVVHDQCGDRYRAQLNGLTCQCPVCKGKGQVDDPERPRKERVPWGSELPSCAFNGCRGCGICRGGKLATIGYEKMNCRACKGHGYTAKPLKPITQTVTIGWEEEK